MTNFTRRTRYDAVLILADAGWSADEIARAMGHKRTNTVKRILEQRKGVEEYRQNEAWLWETNLSVRAITVIRKLGIRSWPELVERLDEVLSAPGVGATTAANIRLVVNARQ